MRNEKVNISVIIPVYNAAAYVARAVESVLIQEDERFEIILVNDGSEDDSAKICDMLAAEDSRIRVIHKDNGGVSSARNAGLAIAVGDFVMFLDADDLISHETFNLMYSSECDFVLAGFEKIRNSRIEESYCPPVDAVYSHDRQLCRFMDDVIAKRHTYLLNSACFKLFRRSIIVENGLGFIEGLDYAEDKMFVMEFLLHVKKVRTLPSVVYSYMLQPDSLSSDVISDRHLEQVLLLLEHYHPLLLSLEKKYDESTRVAGLYHNDFIGRYVFRILTTFLMRGSGLMTEESLLKLYRWMDEDADLGYLTVRPGQFLNLLLYRLSRPSVTMTVYHAFSSVISLFSGKSNSCSNE